jgi:hypothetical protein
MKQINISLDENDLEKLKEWFHSSSEEEAVRDLQEFDNLEIELVCNR